MNPITEDTPIVSIVLVLYSSSSTNYRPRRISTAAVSSLAQTIILYDDALTYQADIGRPLQALLHTEGFSS